MTRYGPNRTKDRTKDRTKQLFDPSAKTRPNRTKDRTKPDEAPTHARKPIHRPDEAPDEAGRSRSSGQRSLLPPGETPYRCPPPDGAPAPRHP